MIFAILKKRNVVVEFSSFESDMWLIDVETYYTKSRKKIKTEMLTMDNLAQYIRILEKDGYTGTRRTKI